MTLTITELVEILEQSNAHRDLIRYVKKADDRGGTPLLSSLKHSLNHVTAEKWATRGTPIEETLYRHDRRFKASDGYEHGGMQAAITALEYLEGAKE